MSWSFLLSLARKGPKYALLDIKHLEHLAGIRWMFFGSQGKGAGTRRAAQTKRLLKTLACYSTQGRVTGHHSGRSLRPYPCPQRFP